MDPEFWHRRWAGNEIGFHLGEANPLLLRHWPVLGLKRGARVFLPLCGKTRDIHWLLAEGLSVVGAELSRLAVDQLFEELGLIPVITPTGALLHYRAPGLDLWVGDLFALDAATLGPVDAVYDRAALVALPGDLRPRYAAQLMAITGGAPQLLITYEYDPGAMTGPPFAVAAAEVHQLYGEHFAVAPLERGDAGLRGVAATECTWALTRA